MALISFPVSTRREFAKVRQPRYRVIEMTFESGRVLHAKVAVNVVYECSGIDLELEFMLISLINIRVWTLD